MAERDFAVYEYEGQTPPTTDTITTTAAAQDFETEVWNDGLVVATSDSRWTLQEDAKVLIGWDLGFGVGATAMSPSRAEVLGRIRINGTARPSGASQGYWRDDSSCDRGCLSAVGGFSLASADYFEFFARRSDGEGTSGDTDRLDEGGFWIYRIPDDWDMVKVQRSTSADAASTSSKQYITFNASIIEEGDWSYSGDTVSYSPTSDGEFVFLVGFSVEAESDAGAGSARHELYTTIDYDDDALGGFAERGKVSTYTRGLNGCTTHINALATMIESTGETNGFEFKLGYYHDSASSATATPPAGGTSMWIVAVPKAEAEWFLVRKATGGQAADTSGYVEYGTADYLDTSYYTHPVAGQVEAELVDDVWTMVFAHVFTELSGSRDNTARLNHELTIRDNGAEQMGGRCRSYNRGTQPNDETGKACSAMIRSSETETISLYHTQESSASDSVVDWSGDYDVRLMGMRVRGLLNRQADEAEGVAEAVEYETGFFIQADEAEGIQDAPSRHLGLVRQQDATEGISETSTHFMGLVRQVDETEGIADEPLYWTGLVRQVDETEGVADAPEYVVSRSVFVRGNPTGRVAQAGGLMGNVATEQT